jgi:hypothetical protein
MALAVHALSKTLSKSGATETSQILKVNHDDGFWVLGKRSGCGLGVSETRRAKLVGGSAPTPDRDIVEVLGQAAGTNYEHN